jgi:hypothetical protein
LALGPRELLVLFAARAPAEAHALTPRTDRLAEADGELLDLHARPLGRDEVPELVPEHDEPEAEDQEDDRAEVCQVHPCASKSGEDRGWRIEDSAVG